MTHYKAPLRDIHFVRDELLEINSLYQELPGCEEASPDLVDAILEEGAKFCEEVLAPLNAVGDEEGCSWKDGNVSTPTGFKEAYQQFVAGGWPAMDRPVEYGGQGLPESLQLAMTEMLGSSNWSWGMYPGLSHGAMNTLETHGTEEQKQIYLTKLIEGTWTGTMCLTEPHAGTDLGLLSTKAAPNDDGSYRITGTKTFISAGDHDLAENILHIILARLPDAPAGTKGISLFIVPKFNVDQDGNLGERNAVNCSSIEHKMGIHGNSTCVINFDGAKGFLVGPPHRGLPCMFTFMNSARIGTAIQGLAHAELAYQNSLAYAKDRLQMRATSGAKLPNKAADPIIVHPDVRRMLLTQRAIAEGGRMLIHYAGTLADRNHREPSVEERENAEDLLSLLTPIAKAFLTELGFEAANLGLQCFGGHGYIREWGMEQNVRDARIATLYEGTTGIQALDLLGRKVLSNQGKILKRFTKQIHHFCQAQEDQPEMKPFIEALAPLNRQWGELTTQIGGAAMKNLDEIGAASFDYLMYSGYVVLAYFWARAASVSLTALARSQEDQDFYKAKLRTARFYYERILPRTKALAETMVSGVDNLMGDASDCFDL